MKVVFYPEFNSIEEFNDIYFRAVWHFNHVKDFDVEFLVNSTVAIIKRAIPKSFDSDIARIESDFYKKVNINKSPESFEQSIESADIVMKWQETEEVNKFVSKLKNKKIYRVDPSRVRQEGSFYIQSVFDSSNQLNKQIRESKDKFQNLAKKLGEFDSSWVLATGPSVEEYKNYDFDNSLVIACNSTVLDDELFNKTSPKILVFADPIFHFGVSRYAAEFRKIVLNRLKTSDINIVIPLKYYSLLTSIFSEYADRIIGIEFDNKIDFNLDLRSFFKVKTTSNILTLLLLPLATTFAKSINVLGCDGRPFENDDYFWGHGKSVQINSEMDNIQEVHPGFFKIDYNEYYFEHCHILDVMVSKAHKKGISIQHKAPSFIPALRDTFELPKKELAFDHAVVIEPDGIGTNGHYVPWHNQLISELKKFKKSITVLCNRKQNTSLYDAEAVHTFTSHSWAISRSDWSKKKDFADHASYKKFASELEAYLEENKSKYSGKVLTLFCYYGSIQIIDILNKLKRKSKNLGIDLRFSVCLFHESVILDSKQKTPKLPPQSRTILLEAVAQRDVYNIRSVTERLSVFFYDKIEVEIPFMANPLPASKDTPVTKRSNNQFTVLFPCALREEKGSEIVKEFSRFISTDNSDIAMLSRPLVDVEENVEKGLCYISEDLNDEAYRSLLLNSDVIVIPYLAPQFTYRTSGIIVDAMLAGKPVITIEGTWLSDIVKRYKFGLPIKYFSPFSLMSAINTIRQNHRFFGPNAKSSFEKYNEQNSWANLVDEMFAVAQKRAS